MTEENALPSWLKGLFISTCIFLTITLSWIGYRIAVPSSPTFFAGAPPESLGVMKGHLNGCPNSPNCVSSQSNDAEHQIAPFAFSNGSDQAIAQLKQMINHQERTQVIQVTNDYLRAEFSTRWLGFVDDVEFLAKPDKNIIEVRSASRLGESDLGVNRQRVETIRQLLESS